MAAASAVSSFSVKSFRSYGAGVGCLVLLLLDREDVRRALDAGQQVRAVVGLQESLQRLDALDDQRQIILAAEREHGVDQVVPRALLAQVDLQAVGEEGEEVSICIESSGASPDIGCFAADLA